MFQYDLGFESCWDFQVFEDVATALEDTLFPEREDGLDRRACPKCKDGRLYLNGSPSGAFVACSNYRLKGDQKCKYIRNFAGEEQSNQEWEVGIHPEYNSMIYIKSGRYGRCYLTCCTLRYIAFYRHMPWTSIEHAVYILQVCHSQCSW